MQISILLRPTWHVCTEESAGEWRDADAAMQIIDQRNRPWPRNLIMPWPLRAPLLAPACLHWTDLRPCQFEFFNHFAISWHPQLGNGMHTEPAQENAGCSGARRDADQPCAFQHSSQQNQHTRTAATTSVSSVLAPAVSHARSPKDECEFQFFIHEWNAQENGGSVGNGVMLARCKQGQKEHGSTSPLTTETTPLPCKAARDRRSSTRLRGSAFLCCFQVIRSKITRSKECGALQQQTTRL
jgi:hypothetical protein